MMNVAIEIGRWVESGEETVSARNRLTRADCAQVQ
jgi:hypothetical protein